MPLRSAAHWSVLTDKLFGSPEMLKAMQEMMLVFHRVQTTSGRPGGAI